MNNSLRFSAGALVLGLPLLSGAQGASSAAPDTTVSSLRYQSAFGDYKPYQDIPPGDWKALNDAVRNGDAGQTSMGAMDMSHGMSMPARDAAGAATPSPPMHRGGAPSMPRKRPARKSSPPAPMQMDAAHPMSGGKP